MTVQSSDVKNYTRGGQITLHNIRMFIQITNKVTWVAAIVFLLVAGSITTLSVSEYEWYVLGKSASAEILSLINENATTGFIQPNGEKVKATYFDIQHSQFVHKVIHKTSFKLIYAIIAGLIMAIFAFLGVSKWLKKRGLTQTEDNHLKGDILASQEEAKKMILNKTKTSTLTIGDVPLPYGIECQHIFIHGTTGSGKSTYIWKLLKQIRERGERAIVYDKSCNYLEEFYREDKDALLNSLDNRTRSWHLWLECRDSADYDSLAAAQIPMLPSAPDPFWVNAARTIFATAAFEMRNDPRRNIIKLLRYLLTADLQQIQHYLKGTVAESLVSEKIEKTAVSIKSVLATYLKSLRYIKDEANPFSIREWVRDDNANNWLFITSLGDRHETLKPLISMWLDIAVNTLISLSRNDSRRIWIVLDEIYSLQQIPYLESALSEARKFGGCAIIGLQNYPQLVKIYGGDGARAISSLLNTRLFLREPDPDVAKWSALNLGESIIDEVKESISYGANTMRDGISINRVETRKPLVSYSQITQLSDLSAYLRLPGDYPVIKTQIEHHGCSVIFRSNDPTKKDRIKFPKHVYVLVKNTNTWYLTRYEYSKKVETLDIHQVNELALALALLPKKMPEHLLDTDIEKAKREVTAWHLSTTYHEGRKLNSPYIARSIDETQLKEVDALIEKFAKPGVFNGDKESKKNIKENKAQLEENKLSVKEPESLDV